MVSARLGAVIALTLASVTITVAYDRARDSDSKVSTTSTTTRVTVPGTAPTLAEPSSTVDITSLTPATDVTSSVTSVPSSVTSSLTSTPVSIAGTGSAASAGVNAGGASRAVPLDDRTWKGSGQQVTFLFAGDTQFEGSAASQLEADPSGVLAPMAPVMSQADITMVNLETAITDERLTRAEGLHVPRAHPAHSRLWPPRGSTW